MKTTYKTSRKYKCPYCEIKLQREQLVDHVQKKHEELIPEGYTAARSVYDSINGKNYGTCMICKSKVYKWNDKIDKYYNLCDNPKCREEVRRIALERHMRVYNKPTLLNNPEQQEKMLANRKISGTYTFRDGGKFTYTGQYERKALEFIDTILEIPSRDIQAPGPVLEYEYGGQTHKWITDIYYIPANLLIEVKDGGSNPNKRVMTTYREKQEAKEVMVTNLGTFNYIRLTNNDFAQLLDILADMKYEAIDAASNNRPVNVKIHVNESSVLQEIKYENDKGEKIPKKCPKCGSDVKVFLKGEPVFICSNKKCNKYFGTVPFKEEVGGLPPQNPPEAYITPCGMNNVFSGFAYFDDYLDRPITIDDEGYLTPLSDSYTTGTKLYYNKYDNIKAKINEIHEFIKNGDYKRGSIAFAEMLMGKKLKCYEEVIFAECFTPVSASYENKVCNFLENSVETKYDAYANDPVVEVHGNVSVCINPKGYYLCTPDNEAFGFFSTIDDCVNCGYMRVLETEYQNKMKKMDGEKQ